MSQPKPNIHLCIKLFIAFVCLSLSIPSQSQSLIGNENIKNFQPNASVDIVINVGSGNCQTVISNIRLGGKKLLITIDKPLDCTFNTLDLILGEDILPLQGLSDAFEMDTRNYKLRENVINGALFFEAKNSITSDQIKNIKIRETFCKGGHCLTSIDLAIAPQLKTTSQQQPGAFMGGMFGGQITPRNSIAYNNDGTIIGHDGITWRRCALGKVWDERNKECIGNAVKAPWLDMVDFASKDNFGGFNDWRLPTESEITGLVGNSKGVSCRDLLPRVGKFFASSYSDNPVIYQADHWLLNNSDDMKNPMSMNLRVEAGFACRFMSNDLRAHAPQPAILVRGGVIPKEWKMVISKTPQAQALFNQSKKEGVANLAAENAYMNKVVEQVKDVLSTPPTAATNTNSASNLSKPSGATAIRSETYDNAGRKTEGYWVKCSGGSETRVYRTAWDNNRSWYKPGGGNGYFVADGSISINDVAQRICK